MWKTVLELEPGFTSAHWRGIPVALLLPLDYSLLLFSTVCMLFSCVTLVHFASKHKY